MSFDAEINLQIADLDLKPLSLEQATLGALRHGVFTRTYAETIKNFSGGSVGENDAFKIWVEQDTGYMALMAYRYSAEVLRRLDQATGQSASA